MKPVLAILLSILSLACAAASGPGQPNVIFLLSDDQRFDTIHALGNPRIRTPNLDRLARDGVALTSTFCMGSGVGAVCVPSRAMILTGRSLFRATESITSGNIPAEYSTWPETFRRAGYTTAGFGKWHNDRAAFHRSFTAGGAIFFGGMGDHTRLLIHDYDPSGAYNNPRAHAAGKFSSELFADAAIDFLHSHTNETPFAMQVAFTAPHDPRTPPPDFARMYDPDRMRLPPNFRPEHPFDNGEMTIRDEALLPRPRDPQAVRREIAAYYAMITHLDAQVGRILDALKKSGRAGNTIVVFASDHGLALGSHGLLGKQNLYDHSVRSPVIISGPGITRGGRSSAMNYLFDLYPTLCDLAGIPSPSSVEGRSFASLLHSEAPASRPEIFGAYRNIHRMIRTAEWKLVEYPQTGRIQLFRLSADPHEETDLAGNLRFQPEAAQLLHRLRTAQQSWGDPLATAR